MFFGGIEGILALKSPRQWINLQFKKAGKVESKDLDGVFWQASCRIVGLVHLIIQASRPKSLTTLLCLWDS